MALPNMFSPSVIQQVTERVHQLREQSTPQWGQMNASQMLAHLNVMFELALETKHPRPNALIRFLLQRFVKNKIINTTPYPRNSRTAPQLVITHQPNFEVEQSRVLSHLQRVEEAGASFFSGRAHPSFGKLSTTEWSNLLYKHIDHHLTQFDV
jgi:hypothetical protein